MDTSITDVEIVLKRLRAGVPCSESQGQPCRWRAAEGGCDCTIAADKIESDAKVIAALRKRLGDVEKFLALADQRGLGGLNIKVLLDLIRATLSNEQDNERELHGASMSEAIDEQTAGET
jgi:hypothetical protein